MLILDSSFLVAYHNLRDVHHGAAAGAMERFRAGEWTSALLLEYVVLEVATVLMARRDLATAVRVVDTLLESREVEFVPSSTIFPATLETFRRQGEARLSFADAAIVTVARERGIPHVATFDRYFIGLDGISVVPAA